MGLGYGWKIWASRVQPEPEQSLVTISITHLEAGDDGYEGQRVINALSSLPGVADDPTGQRASLTGPSLSASARARDVAPALLDLCQKYLHGASRGEAVRAIEALDPDDILKLESDFYSD
jgi:hypothetical protein